LLDLVQVFIAEKNWEGGAGLQVTDEMQATIAADACLLILSLEHDFYRGVESIVVYSSTMRPPPRRLGTFEVATAPVVASVPRLGEAWKGGPLLLAWDSVLRGARNARDGANVVFHEFAHKLDMLSGSADGVPPLADAVTHGEWVSALQVEYDQLQREAERGRPSFLDRYALTNGAEFFAVATEYFFEQPRRMRDEHGAMYRVLSSFYRQDPAERRLRGSARVTT
jgi:Mlc titration factor MtfA (ptsG expression regulator)